MINETFSHNFKQFDMLLPKTCQILLNCLRFVKCLFWLFNVKYFLTTFTVSYITVYTLLQQRAKQSNKLTFYSPFKWLFNFTQQTQTILPLILQLMLWKYTIMNSPLCVDEWGQSNLTWMLGTGSTIIPPSPSSRNIVGSEHDIKINWKYYPNICNRFWSFFHFESSI